MEGRCVVPQSGLPSKKVFPNKGITKRECHMNCENDSDCRGYQFESSIDTVPVKQNEQKGNCNIYYETVRGNGPQDGFICAVKPPSGPQNCICCNAETESKD